MPDVFLSYSRRDGQFVERLADALRAREREVWMDVGQIEDAEMFPAALRKGIEQSDSFVFVISPDAAVSQFCGQEVAYATQLSKRIVPVLHRPAPEETLAPEIRDRNWIPFQDERQFDGSLERLLAACDRDLDHAKRHTRWLIKALEWEAASRDGSLVLHGSELTAAENWLAGCGPATDPQPTQLQRDYVLASRRRASRRARAVTAISLMTAVIAVVLVVFALISRGQANTARKISQARELAATADANLGSAPLASLVLAKAAVRLDPLPESLYALRAALDADPLDAEYLLPSSACGDNLYGAAAFRPGGRQLVQVGCGGDVVQRDAVSGRVLHRIRLAMQVRGAVGYSADGPLLAVGGDGGVWILDAGTLALRRHIKLAGSAVNVAFSPDGRRLAIVETQSNALAGSLAMADIATGQVHTALRGRQVTDVAWLEHGRRLVVTTEAAVALILDSSGGHVLDTLPAGQAGYDNEVSASADGSVFAMGLATASGDGEVQLWRAAGPLRLGIIAELPDDSAESVAVSSDGSRIAIGSGGGAGGVWSAAGDRRLVTFGGQSSGINSVSFAPDAQRVATTNQAGDTRIWRASGPSESSFADGFVDKAQVEGLVDTGSTVVALGAAAGHERAAVTRWNAADGRRIGSLTTPSGSFSEPFDGGGVGNDAAVLTPDGNAVLLAQGHPRRPSLVLRSATTDRVIGRFASLRYNDLDATFAAKDRFALLQGAFTALGDSGPEYVLTEGTDRRVVLSPGGHPRFARAGAFVSALTSDGRLAVAITYGGVVGVWSTSDGRLLRTFPTGATLAEEADIAISPNDRFVALGTINADTAVWDLRTGRRVALLVGDTARINAVQFTDGGREVVTASNDHTVRVWQLSTAQQLRLYTLAGFVLNVSVAPSGRSMAVSDGAGTISVFDVCSACTDAAALLTLADARGEPALTQSEQAIVADAERQ